MYDVMFVIFFIVQEGCYIQWLNSKVYEQVFKFLGKLQVFFLKRVLLFLKI